jgi:hypothetical protein
LAIHGLRAVLATLLTWPLAGALQLAQQRAVYHSEIGPDDAALLLQVAAQHGPNLVPAALGWLLAYMALSPFLTQLWLRSMLPGWRTAGLLMDALASYPAAVGLGLCWLLAMAGAAGAPVLLLLGARSVPAFARADDVIGGVAAVLGLGCALALVCMHDLARGAMAIGARPPRRALLLGLHRLGWRELGYRAIWGASALALIGAGEGLARLWPDAAWWVLWGLQQALLLLASVCRALWLTRVLHRVHGPEQVA